MVDCWWWFRNLFSLCHWYHHLATPLILYNWDCLNMYKQNRIKNRTPTSSKKITQFITTNLINKNFQVWWILLASCLKCIYRTYCYNNIGKNAFKCFVISRIVAFQKILQIPVPVFFKTYRFKITNILILYLLQTFLLALLCFLTNICTLGMINLKTS